MACPPTGTTTVPADSPEFSRFQKSVHDSTKTRSKKKRTALSLSLAVGNEKDHVQSPQTTKNNILIDQTGVSVAATWTVKADVFQRERLDQQGHSAANPTRVAFIPLSRSSAG